MIGELLGLDHGVMSVMRMGQSARSSFKAAPLPKNIDDSLHAIYTMMQNVNVYKAGRCDSNPVSRETYLGTRGCI